MSKQDANAQQAPLSEQGEEGLKFLEDDDSFLEPSRGRMVSYIGRRTDASPYHLEILRSQQHSS